MLHKVISRYNTFFFRRSTFSVKELHLFSNFYVWSHNKKGVGSGHHRRECFSGYWGRGRVVVRESGGDRWLSLVGSYWDVMGWTDPSLHFCNESDCIESWTNFRWPVFFSPIQPPTSLFSTQFTIIVSSFVLQSKIYSL